MDGKLEPAILIVEDSDEDFAALSRAIDKAQFSIPVYRCEDGEEALDFLYHEAEYQDQTIAPRPTIIILDLNLPGTDGTEVLAAIKSDRDLQSIPVIIFSTSSNPKDIEACYRRGVCGYIVKPMNFTKLQELTETLLAYWFKIVKFPPLPDKL